MKKAWEKITVSLFVKAFFLVSVITPAILPTPASAHVLAQDNGMRIIMHIAPNDDPVAGPPQTIDFLFNPTTTALPFDIKTCECMVTVKQDNKTIGQQSLSSTKTNAEAVAHVTFPATGVYNLVVTGRSAAGAFTVSYAARVTHSQTNGVLINIGLAATFLLIIAGGLWFAYYNKATKKKA